MRKLTAQKGRNVLFHTVGLRQTANRLPTEAVPFNYKVSSVGEAHMSRTKCLQPPSIPHSTSKTSLYKENGGTHKYSRVQCGGGPGNECPCHFYYAWESRIEVKHLTAETMTNGA